MANRPSAATVIAWHSLPYVTGSAGVADAVHGTGRLPKQVQKLLEIPSPSQNLPEQILLCLAGVPVKFVDTNPSQIYTGSRIDLRSLSKKMMISD